MNLFRRTFLLASLGTALPGVAAQQASSFITSESVAALEQFALGRKELIQSLSSSQLVDLMLDFYASAQPVGLAPGAGSDMLLYQWGTYDWGKGRSFEFDMTRQFIRQVDDVRLISQLSVKASYAPTARLDAVKSGDRWCESAAQLRAFREFITASNAYRAVAFMRPTSVAAVWSNV